MKKPPWNLFLIFFFLTACASHDPRKNPVDEDLILTGFPALSESHEENIPEFTESSVLTDYLTYAALKNPGLKAAFLRWKAALEKIPEVKSLPDPRFTYGYFIRNVETRVGPQRHKFGLAQTFPWFGKLKLRGNAAWETAQAEKERYEAAKLKLFFQVKEAYYEYYYLSQAIAVTRENLNLLEYLESVARTQYTTGSASHADIIRAQVDLGKSEDRLRTLKDLRHPIVAGLNAAMNRPATAPLPWPRRIEQEKVRFAEDRLLEYLKQSNPELKVVDFLAAREKWNIDLAKKNYYPDMTLSLETIDTGEADMPNVDDSGKDPYVGMLSINIPIRWGKYRAIERQAHNRYRAFQHERTDRENRLAADVKLTLYKYHDAERKIDLYKNTLTPKAEQSIQVNIQTYIAGKGTFLDVIDSVRLLLEFKLAFERAVVDRSQRLAELEMLVGKQLLKDFE
ncbi:MAG: TolC family protein [Deltaproteobacteria bacterium]|nr:TolC family protein [Deltaproteobacteria bacterium]